LLILLPYCQKYTPTDCFLGDFSEGGLVCLALFFFFIFVVFSVECDNEECDNLNVKVIMKGGKGDVAWQHTQMFRTSLDDASFIGLDILVELKEKS